MTQDEIDRRVVQDELAVILPAFEAALEVAEILINGHAMGNGSYEMTWKRDGRLNDYTFVFALTREQHSPVDEYGIQVDCHGDEKLARYLATHYVVELTNDEGSVITVHGVFVPDQVDVPELPGHHLSNQVRWVASAPRGTYHLSVTRK